MRASTTSPADAAPRGPEPQEMRRAMGAFASGVTIVSAMHEGEPIAFACQSFASVSLAPPLVLFCADHRGRTWPRIREVGRFDISVLAENQGDLCTRFGSSQGRKFEGLEWHESAWGTPVLTDPLLRVHCAVEDVHPAGDHDVVIGRVLAFEDPDENEPPLIYFRGSFGLGVDRVHHRAADRWGWGDLWGGAPAQQAPR